MESFKTLQEDVSAALVATTRSATQLSSTDIPFQRSLDPSVGSALDIQNARLLQLAQRLLSTAAASSDVVGPKLPDTDAIDGNWKGVVDVLDSLLEKADTSLDEYTGVVKRLSPGAHQGATASKSRFPSAPKSIPKPQLAFEHVPQNNESGGFRPLMTSKPHAGTTFADSLKTFKDSHGREQYPHPYQSEIESYEYPASVFTKSTPQPFPPFESTTATFVDTPESLATMFAELKTAKEIAIDLEHHDNRSYIGLVSLMQISTRQKDWIVDTLKPWRRQLECLNEVFADPRILKVLHGSYMDIIWLQRDLGLYIVGLFDTYHAARALGYPGASLAFLLSKFVNFQAQKQYQMADWRTRPLSSELFDYARADTHFLLYIYDNMRNELIDKSVLSDPERNKVLDVLGKSKETALQRYEHPVYDTEFGLGPVGWYKLISRTPVQYTKQQFSVFKAVHKWRDDVARNEDESPIFILPNHAVFSIARTIPKDKTALFNVTQHVSPILRLRADELIKVIEKASNVGDDAPDLDDILRRINEIRFPERQLHSSNGSSTEAIQSAVTSQSNLLTAKLGEQPLRAPESAFWGSLWSNRSSEQRRPFSKSTINLAIPLPPLTAEIFADSTSLSVEATSAEVEKAKFVPKEERLPEDERSDIFVVKQLGGKRKRTQIDNTNEQPEAVPQEPDTDNTRASEADEIMLDDDSNSQIQQDKETKKQRKARKKAAKAKHESISADENGEEEVAFDYSTAPPVLNARAAERSKEKGKKKKDKEKKKPGFNPYGTLQDAPKALGRAQKEAPGRTKTFKQ